MCASASSDLDLKEHREHQIRVPYVNLRAVRFLYAITRNSCNLGVKAGQYAMHANTPVLPER